MPTFFKLNSAYQPDVTIKNFDSLAWTERYREEGDFQLVVNNEASILAMLPVGTLVSHTDTREVMMVENHEISRDDAKTLQITVSGRTLETFAENRPTIGSALPLDNGATPPVPNVEITAVLSSSVVAVNLLRSVLQTGYASASDAVSDISIYYEMRVFDAAMAHVIKRGDAYLRTIEFLNLCDAGIKTLRPLYNQTTIDIVVHDGIDRRASVIFYAQREDLDDAKYFWSIKGYKNYALLASKNQARLHRHRDIPSDLNGLDRRVLYVEASDILGTFPSPTPSDIIASTAQTALDERRKISILQAKISQTARPKFKVHYDVGDLVTVFGEFSTAQLMRVTEHILTVDKDGMRGFPSLKIV